MFGRVVHALSTATVPQSTKSRWAKGGQPDARTESERGDVPSCGGHSPVGPGCRRGEEANPNTEFLNGAMFPRVAAFRLVGQCARGVVHPFPTAPFIIRDRRRGQGVDNPANGGASTDGRFADGQGIGVPCCRGDQPGGGVRDDVGVGLSTLRPRRRSLNQPSRGGSEGRACARVGNPTRPRVLNRAMLRPAAAAVLSVGDVDVGLSTPSRRAFSSSGPAPWTRRGCQP